MHTVRQACKKHNIALRALVLSSIIVSSNAFSFIISGPVHDPKNMIENALKQVRDLEFRITTELTNQAERIYKKELKSLLMEAAADQKMTEQSSIAKLEGNLMNSKVAHQNMPVQGLCANVEYYDNNGELQNEGRTKNSILTFSLRGDLFCEEISEKKNNKQSTAFQDGIPNGRPIVGDSKTIDVEEELVNKIIELQEGGEAFHINDLLPHVYTGLDEGEFDIAADKLRVMLPPLRNTEKINHITNTQYLKDMSKSMRALLPYQILMDQLGDKLRPAEGVPSERESQDLFAEDFMSVGNIENYAYKNMILPSQVQREKAIMTAYLVHMAIQKYKSSLDEELLLSVRLLEAIPD